MVASDGNSRAMVSAVIGSWLEKKQEDAKTAGIKQSDIVYNPDDVETLTNWTENALVGMAFLVMVNAGTIEVDVVGGQVVFREPTTDQWRTVEAFMEDARNTAIEAAMAETTGE